MNFSIKNILIISLICKFALSLFIPLSLDEYYYFLWGQHLSISYFDHPPMVGWLMFFSGPLKFISEGAIRWPFLLMSFGTLLIWLKMLKPHLDEKKLVGFLLIALFNPLWGWGVFIATPDIPLLFFWSLAMFYCEKILWSNSLKNYLLFGFALGMGFLSKYQIVLFLPCLFILLWQQKKFSKLLTTKTIYAIIVAALTCLPVFIWNMQNDWASFDFQWNHGMNFKYWKWSMPVEYVFSQIFIIFPTFLLFFFTKNKKWRKHWLLPFAIFPFVFFLYSSFKGHVEANWVIMALPSLYALACTYTTPQLWKWSKRTLYLWTIIFMAALTLVLFKENFPVEKVKLFEAEKFKNILPEIKGNETYFAYSYQLAGFLSFKKNRLICKFPKYGRPDHFLYIASCQSLPKKFYYISQNTDRWPIEKDFPSHKITNERPIDANYKLIEVQAL